MHIFVYTHASPQKKYWQCYYYHYFFCCVVEHLQRLHTPHTSVTGCFVTEKKQEKYGNKK